MLALLIVAIFWIGLFVFWIVAIASALSFSASAYEAAGRSLGWTVALVVITGWLGAGYYWFVIKHQLEPYRNAV